MYEIKKATIEDIKFLERVENECFPDPWNFDMLESEILSNNATYSILLFDKTPIGYYSYIHIFDEAHILNIAILPEYQGKGYGNVMMEYLLSESLKEGLENVTLEVRKSNVKAIGLYEKYGFKCVGIRPRYYMNGEDALIYWNYRN